MRPSATMVIALCAPLTLLIANVARAEDELPPAPAPDPAPAPAPPPAPAPRVEVQVIDRPGSAPVESSPDGVAAPRDPDAVRLRAGVAASVVFGRSWSTARFSNAMAGSAGIVLDAGGQIGDHAAVFVRVELASLLLTNAVAAYVVGEWTPERWLSFGTGIGCDGLATLGVNTWFGASIPLIVGFNLPNPKRSATARGGMRIGLEGAGGLGQLAGVANNVLGWHTAVSFGGAWM